jgi:hypothetical protein
VRNYLPCLLLAFVAAVLLVLCPGNVAAQQYVLVNDNTTTPGANGVTSFLRSGPTLSIIAGSPFGTTGSGHATYFAAIQQVAISYGGSYKDCLFVSDPDATSSYPNGDVASFIINTGGTLTYAGNAVDPTDTSGPNKRGIALAVDRRVGFPYLFASFTGESKIVFFKVDPNTCRAFYTSSTPAVGVSGGVAEGMAVTFQGPHILAIGYQDGSIQSFKIGGGTLTPTQPPFNSTGFINQGGKPGGVDITKNGKFAVFGDNQFNTEVEVAKILSPSGKLQNPTADYGGAANASGVNLGAGSNSTNVWLSPQLVSGQSYLYITNNYSGQVTTAKLSPAGVVSAIAPGSCIGLFTNPTTLNNPSSFWFSAAGNHTVTTTGSGNMLVVAEYGVPSSVALLKIQFATGCTREAPASPFINPYSNIGLYSVSVFPERSF